MIWPYFIKLNVKGLVLAKMAVQDPAVSDVDLFVLCVNKVKTAYCTCSGECSKSGSRVGAKEQGRVGSGEIADKTVYGKCIQSVWFMQMVFFNLAIEGATGNIQCLCSHF
ncbi:hypothetical protein SAMN02745119_02546 [Trichlorobacter thiogenes]|uniref:Uncharacterized protein n=1 Tax=Trichlorobacter thiogenes TaxID=115783 RepID=A0A1T4QUX4_9BACT|nr:hypothetical protein SAMN02745119_02546 [Trichlorobacter thiogenes]